MKKRQRVLALLTSIGLTLTMSGCGSKKEKEAVPSPEIIGETAMPSPEIVEETATPSPSENAEIVDFELTPEQKEAEFEEIKQKLEADGKYSVTHENSKLIINELEYDANPDYELFKRIIDLLDVNTICIKYCYGNLDINDLIDDKDISIQVDSYIDNSEENNFRIAEKIKSSKVKVYYSGLGSSEANDSIVAILNAVGSKNGSLFLQDLDSKHVCDLLDKIDPLCYFDSIYLALAESTSESIDISKVNGNLLTIASDYSFSEIAISPSISYLYLSDIICELDYDDNPITDQAKDRIRVMTTSDSNLKFCTVSLYYNSTIFDVPETVKLDYYAADYEVAETILSSDYINRDRGHIKIMEDNSSIKIEDSVITYTNPSLDIEETYSTSEFNMDDIRSSIASHQESLEETQNKIKF